MAATTLKMSPPKMYVWNSVWKETGCFEKSTQAQTLKIVLSKRADKMEETLALSQSHFSCVSFFTH